MTESKFTILSPEPALHLQPMGQLTAEIFSAGNYVEAYCDNYIGNSHYDWEASRVILAGGKMVHHWGVWGYRMRLGSILLKVAGIGAVATHADYRKQGLMHLAADESFATMMKSGYDLSFLRGRHYVKMGYARAWNYIHYNLKPEDLAKFELQKPYRAINLNEIGEMETLYNREYAGYSGSAVRPTYLNKHPDDIGVFAWYDAEGKMEGYIRALPDEDAPKVFQCVEAAGDPLQGLAVLGELYKEKEYEKLTCFTLPYLHPILQTLRRGAVIVEDRYFDISGWRVRIVNLQSALTKMIPLLEKRLADSQFAAWQGSLLLDAGAQKAVLKIQNGRVETVDGAEAENHIRGGADIARLLIGSDEPEEIMRQADMKSTGVAIPLARVLFPNLHPMMSLWDEF